MAEKASRKSESTKASDDSAPPLPSEERRFARRVTIATVIVIALVALALLVWYSIQILLLIFAGVLIAILLRALADLVSGWTNLSHRWSLAIVIVLLIALAALSAWLILPKLGEQLGNLADQFQPAVRNLRDKMEESRFGRFILEQSPSMRETLSGQGTLLSRVGGFLSTAFDAVVTLFVILFTAMFLAFDPHLYIRGTLRLVPPHYRDRAGEVMGAVGYTLKWWLIGQGVAMIVIGVATWLGLLVIGVKLPLALGFLAAIFNFIPNFGPLISMVPAILIAMMDSPEKALWVIGLFVVLQNAEGYLVSPNIQRKAVDLPQAVSILAQVMMALLTGGLGFILATPLAAAVHVAVKTLYVEDLLGDDVETPADDAQLSEVKEVKEAASDMNGSADSEQDR